MRRTTLIAAAAMAVVMLPSIAASGAGAVTSGAPVAAHNKPLRPKMDFAPVVVSTPPVITTGPWLHSIAPRARSPYTAGETPAPARVLQNVGVAGYGLVSTEAADSVSISLVSPSSTAACEDIAPAPYPWQSNMTNASASFAVQIGGMGAAISFGCNNDREYGNAQLNTNPDCTDRGCPDVEIDDHPGDVIDMSVSTDGNGNATASIYDETSGYGASYTNAIPNYSFNGTTEVNILMNDYCYFGSGAAEPCVESVPNGQVGSPPPGWSGYSPIDISDATVNGQDLGDALNSPDIQDWYRVNSVYGTTLFDETSIVDGSGDFSITNSDRQLPAIQVGDGSVDITSSGQSMPITVSLSQSSNDQIYMDYYTGDDTAYGGINYTPVAGTLSFPPGTTTETVLVPVNAGTAVGGGIDFFFFVSNASYAGFNNAVGFAIGTGRIYEGPNVFGISPNQVPTNGAVPLVISGVDFGSPGERPSVTFCSTAAPENCATGVDAVVENDNTIDVTSPDASNLLPGDTSYVLADTEITNTAGVSSPLVAADEITFGCQQVENNDGDFDYSACVLPAAAPDTNETEQTSNVDGVNITASSKDQVDYAGAAAGSAVTSTGPVKATINIAGQTVKLYKGIINQVLTGPMVYVPTGEVGGFKFAGALTLTGAGPTATGSVPVTAPAWLGGGTGTMTFTSVVNGTAVQNLQVSIPSASFADLIPLSNVVFTATGAGVWSITATVVGPSGPSLSGNAQYNGQTLEQAGLSIVALPILGGVVNVSDLSLTYSPGTGWTGSASASPDQGGSVMISLTATNAGNITAGSIVVNSAFALGAVPTNLITLTYSGDSWSVSATLPVGGKTTLAGKLKVTKGVVQSGSITLKKLPLFDAFIKLSGTLSYTLATTGSLWQGTISVAIPEEQEVLSGEGISFTLQVLNGVPNAATFVLSSSLGVPLADGILITSLGLGIQWSPSLALTGGTIGIGLGPPEGAGPLVGIEGNITRNNNPAVGTAASTVFTGTLTVLKQTLGSAVATLSDDGKDSLSLSLGAGGAGLTEGPVNIQGTLTGSFGATKFNVSGSGMVTGPGFSFSGDVYADAIGMAACTKGGTGFTMLWGQSPTTMLTGCKAAPFH